jgi:Tfp pilus assembly protein PilV
MPRWQKAALIALVVVAVITIGAFASKTKTSTDTPPSNQPSMTACQALDKLHAEMSSQSSFVAAGKDLLNGLSPSSYDIARVQILGDCPQYAEVLR